MRFYTPSFYTGLFLLFIPAFLFSQNNELEVTRCKSINRDLPIKNLWLDDSNVLWATNQQGVHEIKSCGLGDRLPLEGGQQSVLSFPYGNTDVRWNTDALTTAIGEEVEVTCAYYDQSKKQIWIGTLEHGAYVLTGGAQLSVVENITKKNSKLNSDYITYIGKDRFNRFWVGTEEGVIIGDPDKWKDDLEGYAFQRMRSHNNDVYVLADGEFWVLEGGDKWRAITIDEEALEGDPFDFDIGPSGELWILSRIAAKYDLNTDEFTLFTGYDYYTSEYGRFIEVDNEGTVWIATTDKGLYQIKEPSAITVNIEVTKELNCEGQAGALNVIVEGGKEPYLYAWNDQSVSGKQSDNVGPGEFAVTVTDAAGITGTAEVKFEDPTITITAEVIQAESGVGAADGQAQAAVTGGSGKYKYAWDNGEKSALAKKLTEGSHTLTVTDSKGCTGTTTVAVFQKVPPLNLELSLAAPIRCKGEMATLVAVPTGGKPPLSYQWNNAEMQGDRHDNLVAGTYNLTVTDAAGNSAKALFTIMEPDEVAGDIQVLQPASTGNADGQASVSPKGGNGNFTFAWDNGETTAIAKQLAPGTHTVTITDVKGCTGTATVEITEDILPLQVVLEKTEAIKCAGGTTGIKTSLSGGKPPFTYQWNNTGITSENPSGVTAGFYSLTVTDAEGQTASAGINLPDPSPIVVNARVVQSATTGGTDGAAKAEATGGYEALSYIWDNGETTAEAKQLAPGTHTVTVTDANGCTGTATIEVTEDILPLSVQIAASAPIKCNGGASGIAASVAGGKGPFEYAWSEAAITTDRADQLKAGTYSLTVTDATGQTATGTFELKQPEPVQVTLQAKQPASTNGTDGIALATATGGAGSYTYAWDDGETTAEAKQLAPGTHTVTVTDANGCTGTATIEVTEDILPLSVQIAASAPIKCNGGASGIAASVAGGKGPFEYAWSEAAITTDRADQLKAGTYSLTVTDATGQTATGTFELKQPDPVQVTLQAKQPASTNGSDGIALASTTGGAGSYTYAWDDGETTAEAKQLAPGTHTVTVTDANGCTGTATIEVTEDILPLSVQIAASAPIKCNGGTSGIAASVAGGKGPFEYAWSEASITTDRADQLKSGTYSLTVTDATGQTATGTFELKQPEPVQVTLQAKQPASTNGTDGIALASATGGAGSYTYAWDDGETTAEAKQLAPGTHTVTVTDVNGCTATGTIEVTENILPLSVQIAASAPIKCNGGTSGIAASVAGGKGPFEYAWSEASITTDRADQLKSGTYSLTVTDATGQTATGTFELKQPEPVQVALQAKQPASTNGTDGIALASTTGGAGSYTYAWDDGETTAEAKQLAPGTHTVTVTDANGCTATGTIEVTENILPLSAQIAPVEAIKCNGGFTGIQASVKGGKEPFKYTWSDPSIALDRSDEVKAGTYNLTVTDAAGQTASATLVLEQPEQLAANAVAEKPASTNGTDGNASVKAQGGTGNYTYAWDNAETTAMALKLPPGTHTVTVTDANGCTATSTVEITENILPLEVSIEQTRSIKCAGELAGLKVNANGGKPPFSYKWSETAWSGAEVDRVSAGSYSVVVTDVLGTSQTAKVEIKAPSELIAKTVQTIGATTERTEDGKSTIEVAGGTPPYTIAWDNGENQLTARKLTLGLHRITVTDAAGCSNSLTVDVGKRTLPDLTPGMIRKGQTIKMEQLQFDGDSSNIKPEFYPTLDELYDFLLENGQIVIEVGGHTNNIPPDDYCDKLSSERAKAVAQYIVGKGIDNKRVLYRGYGKRKPVASNATPEGRALNQRVEIKILRISTE